MPSKEQKKRERNREYMRNRRSESTIGQFVNNNPLASDENQR